METEPHAVRWCQYDSKYGMGDQWSKWHWTTDANETLCGTHIPLCEKNLLPETDELKEKVNCKRCLREMEYNDDGQIQFYINGKVQRTIMDWALTHGGNHDPAVWRDTYDMEVPEQEPELLSRVLKEGKVVIPEPQDKWIEILIWNLEDFESHLDTEGKHWLIEKETKIEDENGIQYETEYLTSVSYARRAVQKLKEKLKEYKEKS